MQFEVKAYRQPEGVTIVAATGRDIAEVEMQMRSNGYKVISIRPKGGASARFGRKSAFSVALFSEELLALLEAGLNLIESVDTLALKSKDRDVRRVLAQLIRQLREGLSFSRALESMPDHFPLIYIATVRSSEQTGDVGLALKRFLAYDEQINRVRDKIVSASIYPALLLCSGLIVVLFLLGYVVPRFSRVYEDLGHNLPWMSLMLMHSGQFVGQYGGLLLIWFVGLIAIVFFVGTRPSVKVWVEKRIWELPAIGEKILLYQLARFTRTMSMLLRGGIPFVSALDMSHDLLSLPALREGMRGASVAVKEGQSVSNTFGRFGLATDVGVRLLVVGERSGNLGESMERIASLYEAEISRWIDWFVRLFEPILMMVIGLVIGVIVVLMYMPIFELASSIQ